MKSKIDQHALYTISLFLLCAVSLSAQKLPLGWRHYTIENGLPAPAVRNVFQDSKMRIWVGTTAGFCYFNGQDFTTPPSVKGLGKLNTWAFSETPNGHIWAINQVGQIQIFQGDSVRPYPFQAKIDALRKDFLQVLYFSVDKTQTVWLGLTGLGIVKINTQGQVDIFTPQSPELYLTTTIEGKTIFSSTASKKYENIPPQYKDLKKGLEILESDGSRTVIPLTNPPDSKPNTTHLLQLSNKAYLLNSLNYLHYIKEGKEVWFRPNSLVVRQLYLTKEGDIAVVAAAENGGLYLYKNIEDLHFEKPYRQFNGFSGSKTVQDHEGGFWIGLNEQMLGVAYCPDKNWQALDIKKTFLDESPASLIVAQENRLFISTVQGSIAEFNPKTKTAKQLPPYPWEKFSIGYLFHDKKNDALWIGNRFVANYKKGQWQPVFSEFTEGSGSNGGTMKRFTQSAYAPDTLWGCSQRSIFGIRRSNNQVFFKKERLTGGFSTAIFQDNRGIVWVGMDNGLAHLKDTNIVAYKLPETMPKRFEVTNITQMADGTLLVGTNGTGLLYKNGDNWSVINKTQGLIADIIGRIKCYRNSNIVYVCTPLGLNKLVFENGKAKVVEKITKAHGLPDNSVRDIDFEGKTMYVATEGGVVFAENIYHSDSVIPPQILSIAVNGKPFTTAQNLNLTYHQNNLTFHLLSFQNRLADKTMFRYKVQTQESWNETDNRAITLLGLSPNAYTLDVQAQNEDGVWSTSLKMPFIIRPPWYASWWFRSLLILSALAGGYLFYKNRIRNLKREHDIALQINDLERTALAMQMNPHFIFNCLNSIQLLMQRGDKDKAMLYLGHFAKLVRFTLESTRRGKITIAEEVQALTHYLSLEKLRFKAGLNYTIDIDNHIDTHDIEIPAMLIQPFVENALKHGLSTEQTAAHISVHFKQTIPNFLIINIKDNGKGVDENEKKEANTEGVTKTGVGIALSRKRLALLNGREDSRDLVIEPILDAGGKNVGTCVRMTILIL